MKKINFLKSIVKKKRQVKLRKKLKSKHVIQIARKFGKDYFDGSRKYGYGGYHYDGRWKKVVYDLINYYKLKPGDKVLDIGCAKGYLVKDFLDKKIDAYGLDISQYAIDKCHPKVRGRLYLGNASKLPFSNKSFKLVISINTIHNLEKKNCSIAIKEMIRTSSEHTYLQVDAYNNLEEKKIFLDWVLTAKYHNYCKKWEEFLRENKYTGEYYWTFV
tara:strand:+ start:2149 stop:2796 length:648 start_codon:yes stop_codon:yes gene_type:complete